MSSITVIRSTPTTGVVNSTILVEWKFGYDVPWEPTSNDELRLLTTSGVLVSRVSLRDAHHRTFPAASPGGTAAYLLPFGSPGSSIAQSLPGSFAGVANAQRSTTTVASRHDAPTVPSSPTTALGASQSVTLREAYCTLPSPPFGGSFVIAFIDCANNFKRVYTVPYRVVGPEYLPNVTLHLQPHPVHIAAEQERLGERRHSTTRSSLLMSSGTSALRGGHNGGTSMLKESIEKSTLSTAAASSIMIAPDQSHVDNAVSAAVDAQQLRNSQRGVMEEVQPHERLTVRFDASVIMDVLNTLPTLTTNHSNQPTVNSVHSHHAGRSHNSLKSNSDVALRLASTSSFRFLLVKAQLGDNLGFSAFGVGVFDHCAAVSRVPVEAFEAILSEDGSSEGDGPMYQLASLIAPAEEGEYEVRLAVIPAATGLPYSIARSLPFRVQPQRPLASQGRLFGELTLHKQRCMAGEPLTLSYEVHSADTHLLSRLDSVGFLPYGRPEAFPHPDAMHVSVMEQVAHKTLRVRAPTEPGVFEAAVYSFTQQQPSMLSQPLVVLPPKLAVNLCADFVATHGLQSKSTLHGKAVWCVEGFEAAFQVLVPACVCHPRDRLVLVDEGSNVVYQARIPLDAAKDVAAPAGLYSNDHHEGGVSEYDGCDTTMKQTTVVIQHPIPGKYTVHFYSFNNGRFVFQAPLYIDLLATARHLSPLSHLPTGAISVLESLPDDAKIEIMFRKEGADARPSSVQQMDCVCLYAHGTPDMTCAPFLDATTAAPYLAAHYLRGSPSETFFFPSLEDIRKAIKSTLQFNGAGGGDDDDVGGDANTSTANHQRHGGGNSITSTSLNISGGHHHNSPLRGSISGSRQQSRMVARADNAKNSIRKATSNPLLPWLHTGALLESLMTATKFSIRYMACIDGHHQRVCLSEAVVSIVPRTDTPHSFRAVPLRQVAVRELAMISHRHTTAMTDGSISAVVTPIAMGRRAAGSPSSSTMRNKATFSSSKGALRFLREQDHEFRGAILAPRSCDATDSIVVTFHITDGMPRVEDMLLLFSVGGTTPIVSCLVSLATDARPDLSLGTVLLKPPALEGSYVVGYFSNRYGGVVLTSEPVRVITTTVVDGAAGPRGSVARGPGESVTTRKPRVIGGGPGGAPGGAGSEGATNHRKLQRPLSPIAVPSQSSPSSAAPSRLPRCKVLLVGVSYFQQPHELKGPLNDVEAMTNIARKYFIREDVNCRYDGHNGDADNSDGATPRSTDHLIRVLQESTSDPSMMPTANNILQGLAWLAQDVIDGDQLVFYFSGAGSVLPDGSRALLPVDFDWQLRVITPKMITEHLLLQVPATVATTVLLDCCHYSTRLEAFRRTELKHLSAGEEEEHAGWGGLQRRRRYEGVGVAPWRCILPSKGTHEENAGASVEEPNSHFSPLLVDTSTLCSSSAATTLNKSPTAASSSSRPLAVVYEACRSAHGWGDGAWDVFVRDAGATRGLFTHNLCSIMEAEAGGAGSVTSLQEGGGRRGSSAKDRSLLSSAAAKSPLLWFELHERMLRKMEGMSYRQAPRLWAGSGATLTLPVALSSQQFDDTD